MAQHFSQHRRDDGSTVIEHVTMGFVATAIAAAVIVFLLSAFAPTNSTHRFWLAIKKLRNILDLVCYWFFNLCAIGTILYMIGATLFGLLNKGKEIEVNTATIVICAVIAAVVLCVIGGMIRNVKHGKSFCGAELPEPLNTTENLSKKRKK